MVVPRSVSAASASGWKSVTLTKLVVEAVANTPRPLVDDASEAVNTSPIAMPVTVTSVVEMDELATLPGSQVVADEQKMPSNAVPEELTLRVSVVIPSLKVHGFVMVESSLEPTASSATCPPMNCVTRRNAMMRIERWFCFM